MEVVNDQVIVFLVVKFVVEPETGIKVIVKAVVGHCFFFGGGVYFRKTVGGERGHSRLGRRCNSIYWAKTERKKKKE